MKRDPILRAYLWGYVRALVGPPTVIHPVFKEDLCADAVLIQDINENDLVKRFVFVSGKLDVLPVPENDVVKAGEDALFGYELNETGPIITTKYKLHNSISEILYSDLLKDKPFTRWRLARIVGSDEEKYGAERDCYHILVNKRGEASQFLSGVLLRDYIYDKVSESFPDADLREILFKLSPGEHDIRIEILRAARSEIAEFVISIGKNYWRRLSRDVNWHPTKDTFTNETSSTESEDFLLSDDNSDEYLVQLSQKFLNTGNFSRCTLDRAAQSAVVATSKGFWLVPDLASPSERQIEGVRYRSYCEAVDQNSSRVLFGSVNGTALLYEDDEFSRRIQCTEDTRCNVRGCAIAKGGRIGVVVLDNGQICQLDLDTGVILHYAVAKNECLLTVRCDDEGSTCVAGSSSGYVYVVSFPENRMRRVLHGAKQLVFCVDIRQEAGVCLSGGTDGILNLWDSKTGEKLASFNAGNGWFTHCALANDGWHGIGVFRGSIFMNIDFERYDVGRRRFSTIGDVGFRTDGSATVIDFLGTVFNFQFRDRHFGTLRQRISTE